MSEQSKAYARHELLRFLESARESESAKSAAWSENLKSHPGYQALIQDPEWCRISAAWQAAIEQDKQDRAFLQGRWWEDLSDDEKAKCEALDAALHERLFPLRQAMMKLREDYRVPAMPDDRTVEPSPTPEPATADPKRGEGKDGPRTRKRRRKTAPDPDREERRTEKAMQTKSDARLWYAWHHGGFIAYAELAKAMGISEVEVRRALDRHKKRLVRAGKWPPDKQGPHSGAQKIPSI